MRWLAALSLVMACTEHGKGGGDIWDVRAVRFAEATCQNACVPVAAQEDCILDKLVRLDRARELLTPDEEARCLECLRVRTDVMPGIVANQCQQTEEITAQLEIACDGNPCQFD